MKLRYITILWGILLCVATKAQDTDMNASPYAFIGDQTKTLEASYDTNTQKIFDVTSVLTNGKKVKARFNFKSRIVSVEDDNGHIISIDTLSVDSKAFTTIDPHAESYYHLNPYAYCGGNPVNAIDPDGRDIYMLFYVTGNGREEDDSMFKASAETRKRDIENSKGFNANNDIVILRGIQDLGKLGDEIGRIINDYSEQYGKTAEFGMWSHNGFEDGPIGSTATSGADALDQIQMTVNGWAKIDFNWSDNASAGFYGCNSGRKLDNRASFTTTLSGKRNFRDVDIYGQTNFSYPSTSSSSRKTSLGMLMGKFSVPTYMVGCDMGNGLRSYFGGKSISPMRKSRNGIGRIIK